MNDIRLNSDYDLAHKNGDLVIGHSDGQHQDLIIQAHKGDFKEFPLLGVGITRFLKDDEPFAELAQEIQRQFESDGAEVEEINFNGSKVYIDASYS